MIHRNVFKVVGTPQRTDRKSLKVLTNRLKDIAKIGKTLFLPTILGEIAPQVRIPLMTKIFETLKMNQKQIFQSLEYIEQCLQIVLNLVRSV